MSKSEYLLLDHYGTTYETASDNLTNLVEQWMNAGFMPIGGVSITVINNPDQETIYLVAQAMFKAANA